MSEDQRPHRPAEHEDEVEAHIPKPARPAENLEAGDETESGDEVEAHGHHRLGANAEAGDEAEGDDDFEAHSKHRLA